MFKAAIVLMQFMISAQAGLVNYVEGPANVQLRQQVPAGMPIETGPLGHAEILLNPGSFLRLGENSTVVLDSVELTRIAIRVLTGTVSIESAEIDKQNPIRVTTGDLSTLIISPGLYRFSGNTASVLDGKLRTTDPAMTLKKGHQVTTTSNGYEKTKLIVNAESAELDRWSEGRSSQLARANALAYRERSTGSLYSYSGFPYWVFFPGRANWFYSPLLNGFTLIPQRNYRSHWGYRFAPVFVFGAGSFSRSTVFRAPSVSRGPSRTMGSRGPRPQGSLGRSHGSIGVRRGGFGGMHRR